MNTNTEVLTAPLHDQQTARIITIDPGRYDYDGLFRVVEDQLRARRCRSPAATASAVSTTGTKHAYLIGGGVRMSARLNASASTCRGTSSRYWTAAYDDGPGHRARSITASRPAMFFNALLQDNTDAREWSSNVRLQPHPPAAERFLPRVQRSPRFGQRRGTRSRAGREGDVSDGVLIAS